MDARLKKLLSSRRGRSSVDDNSLVCHDAPSPRSSPNTQRPTFFHEIIGQGLFDMRQRSTANTSLVKGFAYQDVQPGKAPIFGTVPQKGNGPVKLRASRRLSSGDLIATSQDSQRTLKDIRDGDYVVGGRDRLISEPQEMEKADVSALLSPSLSRRDFPVFEASSPIVSSASETWSNTSPVQQARFSSQRRSTSDFSSSQVDHRLSSLASAKDVLSSEIPRKRYRSYSSTCSTSLESSTSPYHPRHDSSATLKALRKAEYSMLVEMYGPDTAAYKVAQLDSEHMKCPPPQPLQAYQPRTPTILNPLPPPPTDMIDADLTRTSRISGTSENYYDECSSSSSLQRGSYASSQADSSVMTGQTSIIYDEPDITRDEIRIMVEQMRSTYLKAIEGHAPPARKTKPRKRKSRSKTELTTYADDFYQPKVQPSPVLGRKSWNPEGGFVDAVPRRRTNSQPPSTMGMLSPIQSSDSLEENGRMGLKRADSTTLGGLMASFTQLPQKADAMEDLGTIDRAESTCSITGDENIQVSQNPPRLASMQDDEYSKTNSWLNLEPDSAEEACTASQEAPEQDLQCKVLSQGPISDIDIVSLILTDDLDGLFADDACGPALPVISNPHTLRRAASYDSATSYAYTTPRKVPHFPSIAESPEYARFAQTQDSDTSFI